MLAYHLPFQPEHAETLSFTDPVVIVAVVVALGAAGVGLLVAPQDQKDKGTGGAIRLRRSDLPRDRVPARARAEPSLYPDEDPRQF